MRFLLDTHAFFWFILDEPRLSDSARKLIANSENEIVISPATFWEIAIKISLGKYSLSEPLDLFIERQMAANQFQLLPIEARHVHPVATLPFHHRDPFDRLLIAQAMTEDIPVISGDRVFDWYPIERLW